MKQLVEMEVTPHFHRLPHWVVEVVKVVEPKQVVLVWVERQPSIQLPRLLVEMEVVPMVAVVVAAVVQVQVPPNQG
jgi:hypothetical protein